MRSARGLITWRQFYWAAVVYFMKQETRELVVSLARLEMALEAESLNNSAGPGAANSPGLQKGSGR